MQHKKITLLLSIILILSMSLLLFVACGDDDATTQGPSTGDNPPTPPPSYAIQVENVAEMMEYYSKDVYDILYAKTDFSGGTPDNVYFTIGHDGKKITSLTARYFIAKEDGKELMYKSTLTQDIDILKFINKDQSLSSLSFSDMHITYEKCTDTAISDAIVAKYNIPTADIIHISMHKKAKDAKNIYALFVDTKLSRYEITFDTTKTTVAEIVESINNDQINITKDKTTQLGDIMIDNSAKNKDRQ